MGNLFDRNLLELIISKSQIDNALNIAERKGYIVQYKDTCKFSHDRIQQACFSLIDDSDKASVQFSIGEKLLHSFSENDKHKHLFLLVSLLGQGIHFIENETEKKQVFDLCLKAAYRAYDSTAYIQTESYLKILDSIVNKDWWNTDYERVLELYTLYARVAFYIGQYDLMEEKTLFIHENARNHSDKIAVIEVEILRLIATGKQGEALKYGLEAVKQLGIKLDCELDSELKIDKLIKCPKLDSTIHQQAMRILNQVITPAWANNPRLFEEICISMINISWRNGISDESSVACVFYAGMLCGKGDIKVGTKLGQAGMDLVNYLDIRSLKARINVLYHAHVKHWEYSLHDTVGPFYKAYEQGLESGDIEYACYGVV